MRLQQILCATSVSFLLAASSSVFAEARIQAGDIANGGSFEHLSPGKMVSYYKDGYQGQITFMCELGGVLSTASLTPGKNFEGNGYAILNKGINGPYTWHFHDNGYDTGNIRVRILTGSESNVYLRCYQV